MVLNLAHVNKYLSMKKWERFKEFMENGDWHVHTNYVEGENSVTEMCEQAEKNGLKMIAFTEHVRKELDYDFNALVKDVEKARKVAESARKLFGEQTYIELQYPLYKVRLGDFETREQAERMRHSVKSRGFEDAWIVETTIRTSETKDEGGTL